MTKFMEWPDVAIDLIVGGTPCQSFSVAGLRAGLDDPRGNLALTYLAIVARYRPTWVVWENVPGVLSSLSHDAPDPCPPPPPVDLGCDGAEVETDDEYDAEELHAFNYFLAGLSELGYGFSYRVLDAQFFGVPQRRRRVFVIGYFGDWRPPAAVLFERDGLRGNLTPRGEAGTRVAALTKCGVGASGADDNQGQAGHLIAAALTTNPYADRESEETKLIAHALNGNATGRYDGTVETLITHSLRGEGFDASEDGTGRGTPLIAGAVCKALGEGGYAPDKIGNYVPDADGMSVRRLTPRECERLQGFPDDYTLIDYRGKPAADGPRYRVLGNSMAVPVMRWIGARIALFESILHESGNG